MNKLFIFLGLYNFCFGAATVLTVIDESKEPKPDIDLTIHKVEIPNTIVEDKHKKLRHYPLTREQRPKSYTTPALQTTIPGEIRYLHPAVSQATNRATLPEYRLETHIRNRDRCKKGLMCVVLCVWTMVTTGSIILASQCKS